MGKNRGKIPSIILLSTICSLLFGCSYRFVNPLLNDRENINLVVAIRENKNEALVKIAKTFSELHPNCKVSFETIHDYDESLKVRFKMQKSPIDIFFSDGAINDEKNSFMMEHAIDYLDTKYVSYSDTNKELTDSFMYKDTQKVNHLYSIPLGSEVNGIFVNTSLLNKDRYLLPSSYNELLNICRQYYKDRGIPIKGTTNSIGFNLFYSNIVNRIVNDPDLATTSDNIKNKTENIKTLCYSEFSYLYSIIKEGYINVEKVQTEEKMYLSDYRLDMANSFLNVSKNEKHEYVTKDDYGNTLFMPGPSSLVPTINAQILENEMKTEFKFILSPISNNGVAYLTPRYGVCVNKNSNKVDWAKEFVSYLLKGENLKYYGTVNGLIPNVTNEKEIVKEKFGITDSQIVNERDVDYQFELDDGTKTSFKKIIEETFNEIVESNFQSKLINTPNGKQMDNLESILQKSIVSTWEKVRR